MHIAVIVPAFNVAPWIGDALASVRAQTHRDWSLVLVDDGSVDATVDAATGFADPRIRLLRQVNAGVAVARNRGLTASASDAILFLDADDWLAPEALARLAGALGQAPAAVAAAARFAFVSEGAAPDPGFQPGSGSRWSGLSGTRAPASGDILPRLLERNLFANGGHLLIRRAALERGGGSARPWPTAKIGNSGVASRCSGGSPQRPVRRRPCLSASARAVPRFGWRVWPTHSAHAWTPSSAILSCAPASA